MICITKKSILRTFISIILISTLLYTSFNTLKSFNFCLAKESISVEVFVYDSLGNELFSKRDLKNNFDIDYERERIIYIDNDNLQHIVYFRNGIIVINEFKDNHTPKSWNIDLGVLLSIQEILS